MPRLTLEWEKEPAGVKNALSWSPPRSAWQHGPTQALQGSPFGEAARTHQHAYLVAFLEQKIRFRTPLMENAVGSCAASC